VTGGRRRILGRFLASERNLSDSVLDLALLAFTRFSETRY